MDDLPLPLWVLVLIPLALGLAPFLYAAFERWMKLQTKKLEIEAERTAEKAAQYAAHSERLDQRIQTLERIITDKGLGVSNEIERLRDHPLN